MLMRILFASLSLFALGPTAVASIVFINELHYDNTGTDVGEGVELAGTAGIDLTGWQLVFYNGSNGTAYDTLVLSGVLPNQEDGFGAAFFGVDGLQNGPDGIALVDTNDSVLQFLSYEGSFVATAGAALGLTSTDIGISGSGSAVGESLQLTGSGQEYADFSWQGPLASSYGLLNPGQDLSAVPLPGAGVLLLGALAGIGFHRRAAAPVTGPI